MSFMSVFRYYKGMIPARRKTLSHRYTNNSNNNTSHPHHLYHHSYLCVNERDTDDNLSTYILIVSFYSHRHLSNMHLKHKKAISYGHFLSHHHHYLSQSETTPLATIDQIISSTSSSSSSSSISDHNSNSSSSTNSISGHNSSSSSSSSDEDEKATTSSVTGTTTTADCPSFQPQTLQHYDPYYLSDNHFMIPRQVFE